jgi:uncharacterized protein YjbI with pentapeptide repeats
LVYFPRFGILYQEKSGNPVFVGGVTRIRLRILVQSYNVDIQVNDNQVVDGQNAGIIKSKKQSFVEHSFLHMVLSNMVLSNMVLSNTVLLHTVLLNMVLSNIVLLNTVLSNIVLSNIDLSNIVLSKIVLLNIIFFNIGVYLEILCCTDIKLSKLGPSFIKNLPLKLWRIRSHDLYAPKRRRYQ